MKEFILKQTCGACPEAYNVYRNGKYVGRFRIRYGGFTAHNDVPDSDPVYERNDVGDGMLDWDKRDEVLTAACKALLEDIKSRESPEEVEPIYEIEYPEAERYDD